MSPSQPLRNTLVALAIACATSLAGAAAPVHWVSSWGSAQQIPDPQNELPAAGWNDASLRQIVQTSIGGSELRVRFSNVFGSASIVIDHATIALAVAPGKPDLDPSSIKPLTFGGRASVTIPAGAEYYSDTVALKHPPRANLAISTHFASAPARQTSHGGSRTTSFYVAGDKVTDAAWPEAAKVVHWYQIAAVEVKAPRTVGAVVAIGDSITDGYGVTTDGNNRWTDVLVERLQGGKPVAVINAGIGGGRMLKDGLGPNLAARFERDVIARPGVTHAIVLIGVNDLGGQHRNKEDTPAARKALVEELMQAHRQLVERAHAHGICVVGATVSPYTGSDYYNPGPANEADRQALNGWIRTSGVFDAVADVDAALRDPADGSRLAPQLDSGDHLHPSLAGYRAIANAVPLNALRTCAHRR